MPDVHLRLILYKRISAAETAEELRELQVELIDRFGLLPDGARNLMRIAAIKKLGHPCRNREDRRRRSRWLPDFGQDSRIDPVALIQLVQNDSNRYRLQGSHRLQIKDDLGDLEKRFVTIENLLDPSYGQRR